MNILIREIHDYKKPILTWRENVKNIRVDENAFKIEIDGKVISFSSDTTIHNVVTRKCQYVPCDEEKELYFGASCEEHDSYNSFDDMFTEILECVGFSDDDYIEIRIDNTCKSVMIIIYRPTDCRVINNIDDYLAAKASYIDESEREEYMNNSRELLRIMR